jgi:AcrR family transcriptional regulator
MATRPRTTQRGSLRAATRRPRPPRSVGPPGRAAGPSDRATHKRTRRRVEILRSAAAAFHKRGYHGASVDQIARAVHMTKGNLYYYFRNKEEILFFCHDYSLDVLLGVLKGIDEEGGSPAERLRRLIGRFVHHIIDDLHGTALTMELPALSAPLLKRIIAKRDRFDHGIRQLLEAGVASGELAPGDAKLLTFAILGAINWITRWYDPRGPSSSDHIARTFAEFIMAGLSRGTL